MARSDPSDPQQTFAGKVAGVAGLEPVTSAVTGQRSNQLSYTPAKGGGSCTRGRRRVNTFLHESSQNKDARARAEHAKEVGVGDPAEETYRSPDSGNAMEPHSCCQCGPRTSSGRPQNLPPKPQLPPLRPFDSPRLLWEGVASPSYHSGPDENPFPKRQPRFSGYLSRGLTVRTAVFAWPGNEEIARCFPDGRCGGSFQRLLFH